MYATLYFGIYEKETLLSKYSDCLLLYKRYIGDVLGIWHCADENLDRRLWNQFQADLDEFGKLRWEVSQLSETAIFLDLQLLLKNGIWHCANENLYQRMWKNFQDNLDKFGQLRLYLIHT